MPTRVDVDHLAIRRLLHDPAGPAGKAVAQITERVHDRAKRLLETPGQGIVYRRYRPRRIHRASAPGQPPAYDLGHLYDHVASEVDTDELGIVGRVGTDVDYGYFLEVGTTRIKPRPWLRTALAAEQVARLAGAD